MAQEQVQIFTDGACRGNPGPGGWAALLRCGGKEQSLQGAAAHTTNNRMELTAAIEALAALGGRRKARLTTDSEYVRQGVLTWLRRWKANGWRTAARRPVKNRDLWQRLDALSSCHDIEWVWVRGHSGHAENEMVDRAANEAIDAMLATSAPAGG